MNRRRSPSLSDSRDELLIDVAWLVRSAWRAPELLAGVAALAARAEGLDRGSLSIAVVDSSDMARLHWTHMRVRGPTDVLTFDLGTDAARGHVEGEIVVCAAVAQRAARGYSGRGGGWPAAAKAELALYVVHGVLHLAGYDDHPAMAARRMHAREDELLTRFGLGPVYNRVAPELGMRRTSVAARRVSR